MANLAELEKLPGHNQTLTIDLLRHGEPQGGPMFRGDRDDPLSETGWAQMRQSTAAAQPWSHIVSSPLIRCRAFAESLASEMRLPLTIDHGFKEVNFGEWEGQTTAQLVAQQETILSNFWANPVLHGPEGGEPFEQFHSRIASAFEQLIQRYAQADANANPHLLLVCHGGVIRSIISHILGNTAEQLFKIHVPYACLSRLRIYRDSGGQRPSLVFHNLHNG